MTEIKAVFLDAAGTLFQVRESVGVTYQRVCAAHGIQAEAEAFERGFRAAWKQHAPPFHPLRTRSADDDKSWWRSLFGFAVQQAAGRDAPDSAFEDAYSFYGTGAAWTLFDDVVQCLPVLAQHWPLWVVSNFDRRLHPVLADLGIRSYFQGVILSSEVGASKPHQRMFSAALDAAQKPAQSCLHVGDEEEADGEGARSAGLRAMVLKRPHITLREILQQLKHQGEVQ
jgi:putative hydrolase of the HAD superfamily